MDQITSFTQKLRTLMDAGDVRAALRYLNSQTDYRFTSMYRFDREVLVNLHFFDRQNPHLLLTENVPLMASYCVYVRDGKTGFHVSDSLDDPRVAGHAKKQVVRAYCGMPLTDESGRMFGSVCHFDFEPLPATAQDIEMLEAFAPLVKAAAAESWAG